MKLVAGRAEGLHQAIAFALQGRHVDRQRIQLRQGVLHDRVGKDEAVDDLRHLHRLAQRQSAFLGHGRRRRQPADALARRQQHLAVAVGDDRIGIKGAGADEGLVVEDQPAVGLVGKEIDRASLAGTGPGQDLGQRLQGRRRVNPPGRIVRRIDDDQPRRRRDRRLDRRQVEIEVGPGRHLDRHRRASQRHAVVVEPRRRIDDHLVSRIQERRHGRGDGTEGAGGERDIGGLER